MNNWNWWCTSVAHSSLLDYYFHISCQCDLSSIRLGELYNQMNHLLFSAIAVCLFFLTGVTNGEETSQHLVCIKPSLRHVPSAMTSNRTWLQDNAHVTEYGLYSDDYLRDLYRSGLRRVTQVSNSFPSILLVICSFLHPYRNVWFRMQRQITAKGLLNLNLWRLVNY